LKQKVECSDWLSAYEWLIEFKPKQMKQRIDEIVQVILGLFEKEFFSQSLELLNLYYPSITKFSTFSTGIVRVLHSERQFPLLAQFLLDSNLEKIPSALKSFLNDCLEALIRTTTTMTDQNIRILKSFKPFSLACRLILRYQLGTQAQWEQVYRLVKSSNHKP